MHIRSTVIVLAAAAHLTGALPVAAPEFHVRDTSGASGSDDPNSSKKTSPIQHGDVPLPDNHNHGPKQRRSGVDAIEVRDTPSASGDPGSTKETCPNSAHCGSDTDPKKPKPVPRAASDDNGVICHGNGAYGGHPCVASRDNQGDAPGLPNGAGTKTVHKPKPVPRAAQIPSGYGNAHGSVPKKPLPRAANDEGGEEDSGAGQKHYTGPKKPKPVPRAAQIPSGYGNAHGSVPKKPLPRAADDGSGYGKVGLHFPHKPAARQDSDGQEGSCHGSGHVGC